MQVSIKTIGELQIFHDGQPVRLPASKLTRALLVYLLFNSQSQRCDHLCDLFWPDVTDARDALRSSLSKLGPVLNNTETERIFSDGERISVQHSNLDIDLNHIRQRLQAPSLNEPEFAELRNQLNTPLLDGIDLHENTAFQQWLIAKRQEIADLLAQAKDRLAGDIRYCVSKDGARIAHTSVGQGRPIVKAAAWLSHLRYDWQAPVWGNIFHQLADANQFIRYDGRGSGMSDQDVTGMCFEDMVVDLESVVDANQLDSFALLGISQGAAISIEYAVRHPERVTHLILCSGYAVGWRAGGDVELQKKLESIISLAETGWEQENPAFRQYFSMTCMPEANQQELNWFNEHMRLSASAKNAAHIMSVWGGIDVRDKLAKVTVPTLVIHSLGDEAIPVTAGKEIAAAIPGGEFVGLNSRSHLLLQREPAAQYLIDVIQEFISRD